MMNAVKENKAKDFYTLKLGLFCGSLVVICFIFLRITWAIFMTPLWETMAIAVFLFLFLQIPVIKSYIQSLPQGFIRAFFILFFVFSVCHCISIPRTTFPFVPWNMFSDETRFSNQVKFYKYEAITMSGQKVAIYPELYFRSLANGRIVTDLDNLIGSIALYNAKNENDLFKRRQQLLDDYSHKQGGIKGALSWFRLKIYEENLFSLDEKEKHLNEILKAIASRYDSWHPQDPISQIDIIKGSIDISQQAAAKPVFNPVWHLSLMTERTKI